MKEDYSTKILREFMTTAKLYTMPKGRVIQSSDLGMNISLIKGGYVQRYLISTRGLDSNQSIYGPGDLFPLTKVYKVVLNQELYKGKEIYFYKTMSKAQIYIVPDDVFAKAVKQSSDLYRAILIEAGKRLESNIRRLENISLRTTYHRLAHQLAFFARRYGVDIPAGKRISLPLTHSNLSNILNVSRERVSVSMSHLKSKGLIIISGRNIIIPDVDKLEQEALN